MNISFIHVWFRYRFKYKILNLGYKNGLFINEKPVFKVLKLLDI